jgi:hypothetical protein
MHVWCECILRLISKKKKIEQHDVALNLFFLNHVQNHYIFQVIHNSFMIMIYFNNIYFGITFGNMKVTY